MICIIDRVYFAIGGFSREKLRYSLSSYAAPALSAANAALTELRDCQKRAAGMTGAAQAHAYHREVCPAMEVLRAPVDHLEMIVGSELWPMPTYGDLLFNV